MCHNDFLDNSFNTNATRNNDFCYICSQEKEAHSQRIGEFCEKIKTDDEPLAWWCIQLKCATWEPYPDGPGKIDCDMNRSIYAYWNNMLKYYVLKILLLFHLEIHCGYGMMAASCEDCFQYTLCEGDCERSGSPKRCNPKESSNSSNFCFFSHLYWTFKAGLRGWFSKSRNRLKNFLFFVSMDSKMQKVNKFYLNLYAFSVTGLFNDVIKME